MKQKKESFFKRVKNAVTNFDKYREYSDEKLSVSIKYILKLVLIFAIIITIALVVKINKETNWATDDLNIQVDYNESDLFAAFSKAEVMKMINCLSWALADCKPDFNMDEVYYPSGVIGHDPDWTPDKEW